jgi:ribosomal subunit interface protein
MQTDVQITFRDMAPSDAIAAQIRGRAAKLAEFHGRITACHVVVEAARHKHKSTAYQVHIDLTIPGGEVAISRDHLDRRPDNDMNVAIRNAFDAMEKRLREAARRRRGKAKSQGNGAGV